MIHVSVKQYIVGLVIVTAGIAAGLCMLSGTVQWFGAQQAGAATGWDMRIGEATAFYTISAVYPYESLDRAGAMKGMVEVAVEERRSDWREGGEMYENERQLAAAYPDRPLMRYEQVIQYEKYEAQARRSVSYVFERYEYTGGAHGGTSLSTFTFDDSGAVALSDIISLAEENDAALTRLLVEKLRASLGDATDERMLMQGLGLDPLQGSEYDLRRNFEHFYVTDQGVTFIMDQYQVAPYAAGMPEATFTWAELAPFLKAR